MDVQPHPAASSKTAVQAALSQPTETRRMEPALALASPSEFIRRPAGYGLPCAKCKLYYPADLDHCPTCQGTERVSPIVAKLASKVPQPTAEVIPDNAVLEKEREEFLRQLKSDLYTAHAEVTNGAAAVCNLAEHPAAEPEKAEICKPCYDRLQEQLDVCQGALHMDVKEGAQIIYDAVWADPSDPNKTYVNAANALLTELRKRAGVASLLGPFQSLTH
jgi:hypothetical protein